MLVFEIRRVEDHAFSEVFVFVKHLRLSHLFCARFTPSPGTCLHLDFSIMFDRYQIFFLLDAVNSWWLAIRCYSGFSTGLLNLIFVTVGIAFILDAY